MFSLGLGFILLCFCLGLMQCITILWAECNKWYSRCLCCNYCGCVHFSSDWSIKQCWKFWGCWYSIHSGSNWRRFEACC